MLEITEGDINALMAYAIGKMKLRGVEAEDAVFNGLARAIANQHKYEEKGKRAGWLKAVMFNTFVNNRRHEQLHWKKIDQIYLFIQHAWTDDSYHGFVGERYEDEIQQALDCLPSAMRQTLVLRAEGLAYLEIAEIMNCPVGSVMSRLARARAKFIGQTGMENMADYWERYPQEHKQCAGVVMEYLYA